jgi:K319-like protein
MEFPLPLNHLRQVLTVMESKPYEWEQIRNALTTISSDKQVDIFDVPESTALSTLVFKLTVTDDKDDSGTDDVTVEAEQIPQNESNSEGQCN